MQMTMKHFAIALAACTLLTSACSNTAETPVSSGGSRDVPLASLPTTDGQAMLEHIKVLSADDFEGRAPGTPGEDKTVEYLEKEFREIGLAPGNTDGTFVQKVPLVGITPAPT